MTRLPGLDPEALADLRAREASTGDRSRSRRAVNPFAAAATVEFVEHWPCRGGCGTMVGATQEATTALAVLNARLVTQRQAPIAKAKVLWCPTCKARDDGLAQAQRDGERERRRPHEQTEFPTTKRRTT